MRPTLFPERSSAFLKADDVVAQVETKSINGTAANIVNTAMSVNYQRTVAKLAAVKAGAGSLKIARVGDSTEMGAWATGAAYTGNRIHCPSDVMARAVNSVSYPAHASSWWCDNNMTVGGGVPNSYDPRIGVLAAGWAVSAGTYSICGKVFSNSTTTNAFTFLPQIPVDTFDVWVMCDTGTGTFQMTRTGDAGSGTLSSVNAGGNLPKKFTFTGSLGMANALNFARVTGSIYLIGIDAYNSAQPSVRVWNMGWSSGNSNNLSDTSNPTSALNALGTFAPDLVFLSIGINDWVGALGAATLTTNMQKMITAILPYADVILETPFPSANASFSQSLQKPYVDAVKAVGVTNNLLVNDRYGKWQSQELQNAIGNYGDVLHPSKQGYDVWGKAAAGILLSL